MSDYSPPPPQMPVRERTGGNNGCLIGCIVAALLLFAVMGVVAFGVYYVGSSMVENFTSPAPLDLPPPDLTPEQQTDVDARLSAFATALNGQGDARNLELTSEEINYLVSQYTERDLPGSLRVEIVDDLIQGQVSIALAQFGLGDRYFNGTATIDVSLRHGDLYIFLKDLKAGDNPLPEMYTQQFSQQNMAHDILEQDPELREMVSKLESISVQNGRVVLVAKKTDEATQVGLESDQNHKGLAAGGVLGS